MEENDKKLYDKSASQVADPARRRELKIQQFKKEKELRAKIDVRCFILETLITFKDSIGRTKTQASSIGSG